MHWARTPPVPGGQHAPKGVPSGRVRPVFEIGNLPGNRYLLRQFIRTGSPGPVWIILWYP